MLVPEPDLLRLIIVSGGIAGRADAPRPPVLVPAAALARSAGLATLGEQTVTTPSS